MPYLPLFRMVTGTQGGLKDWLVLKETSPMNCVAPDTSGSLTPRLPAMPGTRA